MNKSDEAFHREKVRVRELCDAIEAGDAPLALQLLADGCPVSNKRVRNTLALAISRADTPERWSIVEALLAAGAQATSEQLCEAIKPVMKNGEVHAMEQAIARGYIGQEEIDELLCSAATSGHDDLTLRLLELGGRPHAVPKNLFGSMFTALELAAHACGHKVTSAMAARLTQEQKDALLLTVVKDGRPHAIPILLEAGADTSQTVKGRNLLQLAPTNAKEVRRLLRAAKTTQRIDSAMPGNDAAPPAPPTSDSFVL